MLFLSPFFLNHLGFFQIVLLMIFLIAFFIYIKLLVVLPAFYKNA